ncbi:acyl-CoA dehydrogenase family protein [Seohaeicola zhoushanensis]
MAFPRMHLEHEHEMFRSQVRRFLQQNMSAKVPKWRAQGHVDREDFRTFGAQGWLCLWAEENFGGPGIRDIRYDQVLQEETIRWTDIGFSTTPIPCWSAPTSTALPRPRRRPVSCPARSVARPSWALP